MRRLIRPKSFKSQENDTEEGNLTFEQINLHVEKKLKEKEKEKKKNPS